MEKVALESAKIKELIMPSKSNQILINVTLQSYIVKLINYIKMKEKIIIETKIIPLVGLPNMITTTTLSSELPIFPPKQCSTQILKFFVQLSNN